MNGLPPDVKRHPGKGGAHKITDQAINRNTTTDVGSPSRIDPRELVRTVRMFTLIDALYGDEPFGVTDDDSGVRFLCPRCGYRTINGGTATPLDAWSWWCWRCEFEGTRMWLEMLVLKSRVAVNRLFRIVNEGAR